MSVNDASQIISDASRVMLQTVASLTDDSRGIIYNHSVVIVQATSGLYYKIIMTIVSDDRK
jgi:hypothetical protein